ncbi:molecular chaperone HtpG [Desulfovibrio inopinatus]|uniref:molecular chaperone HtpG n=1 Tax=Desulfovibrio inopinatus TaxID=102109 RepID=UPI000419FCD1|nr:molecular chaperone HtpG [Desulfovibrio inopinatus]
MSESQASKTYEFKAEIKQLLEIITHSIYTNREIFLRELISNASDALDKVRFLQQSGQDVIEPDTELNIAISVDTEKKVITIKDTGIGMTESELVDHIGTIAKSGSADFLKSVTEQQGDASGIIGKFGVGFYSVFMVADKVVLTTRSAQPDAQPMAWISDGLGSFSMEPAQGDIARGTTIEIHLKSSTEEFADVDRIKSIIKTHSSFISFPILVADEKVNTIAALWREPKTSVTKEQYEEFYKFLTYDSNAPMETIHIQVDAPVQFTSLLFVPEHSMDMFGAYNKDYGLDLYVRRVLIQRQAEELLPEYLGFIKGVVDTEDLPLNISRETLQENVVLRKIASTVTKQALNRLKKLAKDDAEKYATFFKAHEKTFKLGYSDYANRDDFAELVRFNSSSMEKSDELVSFEDYVGRMKEGQTEIYYLSGPSRDALELTPHMEIFRKKGIEVLYLFEPIDEFIMDALRKYKDFDLKSAEHVDTAALKDFADAAEDEKPVEELDEKGKTDLDALIGEIRQILGDKVTDVRLSERLSKSPSCLVSPDGDVTSHMQKIMRLVTKDTSVPKKVLEINKDHPLIRNLIRIHQNSPSDPFISTAVEQLYESALLMEGYLSDPHKMVSRINSLLENSSSWYAQMKNLS